jgi:glycosyltransferase involved in cell wall biosynthesis
METNNSPLVSIIIVTFNSAKYVLETLESAKAQTYENIELIISDDASQDRTLEICRNWLDENKERFVQTQILTVKENSGIPANCNRGLNHSTGQWCKFIAGDDYFRTDAIEKYVNYSNLNPTSEVIFGRQYFVFKLEIKDDEKLKFYEFSQKKQYISILKGSGIPSSAAFIKRNLLESVNGFDEKYRLMEDAPLWIKLSEKGILFMGMDENVIYYRIHEENTSLQKYNSEFLNISFYLCQKMIIRNEIIPRLLSLRKLMLVIEILNKILCNEIILLFGNKNSNFSRLVSKLNISSLLKVFKHN